MAHYTLCVYPTFRRLQLAPIPLGRNFEMCQKNQKNSSIALKYIVMSQYKMRYSKTYGLSYFSSYFVVLSQFS